MMHILRAMDRADIERELEMARAAVTLLEAALADGHSRGQSTPTKVTQSLQKSVKVGQSQSKSTKVNQSQPRSVETKRVESAEKRRRTIARLIMRDGPMTQGEISANTGIPAGSIWALCRAAPNWFVSEGGRWNISNDCRQALAEDGA